MVALAMESVAFGRVIRVGEDCSDVVYTRGALPAGSRYAPAFLRFYLLLRLDDLRLVFRVSVYLYVEGIAMRVMATEAQLLVWSSRAAGTFW